MLVGGVVAVNAIVAHALARAEVTANARLGARRLLLRRLLLRTCERLFDCRFLGEVMFGKGRPLHVPFLKEKQIIQGIQPAARAGRPEEGGGTPHLSGFSISHEGPPLFKDPHKLNYGV